MVQSNRWLRPPWRIGVDIGGTFTDLVLRDSADHLEVSKVPSVPGDPTAGVLAALDAAAARFHLDRRELLSGCALFLHGSTIATNTVLEHKGVRVGLLTTAGFRDTLEIRRGKRENQWDHRAPFAPVLVPRHLRLGVRGRISRDGGEIDPLQEEDVARAVVEFRRQGVEAIAIAFLFSFMNDDHERNARALIRELWPEAWVCISSEVTPILGEYERTSTTVLNAYVGRRVITYLQTLNGALRNEGLARDMLLVQSNGGAVSVGQVAAQPVQMLLSGPAAGAGAMDLYRNTIRSSDLIAMEIGGTSCDVTLMSDGRVQQTDQILIGGYHASIPSVEIHTVGTGGGTIARLDQGGLLAAGPDGAGADPGPAAYGRGGTEPTVTDALLVLGRLRPGPLASGAVTLDRSLAARAIEQRIAIPLGISVQAAAVGILRLMEQSLLHAVEAISTERGHNPQRFTLIACGGAGPMHGATVARALGCRTVYVPRLAGAFCATGMLHTDVRLDFQRVMMMKLESASLPGLESAFDALTKTARESMAVEGFAGQDLEVRREVDLRYAGQQWNLRLSVPVDRPISSEELKSDFEALHNHQFGHVQSGSSIEVANAHVIAIGRVSELFTDAATASSASPVAIATREVWLDPVRGIRSIPIFEGNVLAPTQQIIGPAIIETTTTTVFLPALDRLTVDEGNNFRIDLAPDGLALS